MAACLMPAKAQQPGPFGFGGQQLQNNRADSLCSKIYRDINYVGDGEEYHNLDIYIPKKEGVDKFPVVVHIYGSAWFSNSSKGMADINTICAALLEAGYAVVTPNHRSSMDAKWPAQINDIKAVVRFLRAKAKKFKLDPSFIATSGFSSGAHLASVMATSNGVKVAKCGTQEYDIEGKLGIFTDYESNVNACCEWSGPVDLLHMDCDGVAKDPKSPEVAVMGMDKEGHTDNYEMLSALYYVDPQDVPVGIFHGIKDNVVPHCQGSLFYDKLQANGVKSFLVEVPEGGHGFNMYTPENLKKMVEWFNSARLDPKSSILEKGGTGAYNYALYYKKTSESKWTTQKDFSSTSKISFKPSATGEYDVCSKVKDSAGTIEKKYFTVNVIDNSLKNLSSLSATNVKKGDKVTARCSATGGKAPYTYAVYVKKSTDSSWTTKQSFKENATVVFTAMNSAQYQVCIKVKDASENVVKKYINFTSV